MPQQIIIQTLPNYNAERTLYRVEATGKPRGEETVALVADIKLAEMIKAWMDSDPTLYIAGGVR